MPSVRFMIPSAERFPSVVKLQMEGVPGEVRYVREKTCRVEHVATNDYRYVRAATDYTFDLSCGHSITWDEQPDYCPWCGARVVG